MEFIEYIAEALTRNRAATLNLVKDLTPEQLIWQPSPEANPIGWLLWHIGRAEDFYFHRAITRQGDVWEREGWNAKFNMPARDSGNWTPETIAAFVPPPLPGLLTYLDAVRSSALSIVKGLDAKRLDEHPRPDRPQTTIATLLQSAITHEAEHRGGIEYVIGLMKAQKK
jgi:uncharacterized damage-inducible protein DinB